MFMSLADLRAMPHVSVSQLKTFLSCPKKFYFQYIEKAEPAFRPVALAFGTAWHTVIGHHLTHSTRELPVPREELRDLLRRELEAEVMRDGIPVLFDDEEAKRLNSRPAERSRSLWPTSKSASASSSPPREAARWPNLVRFTPAAEKALASVDRSAQRRIVTKLEGLALKPAPRGRQGTERRRWNLPATRRRLPGDLLDSRSTASHPRERRRAPPRGLPVGAGWRTFWCCNMTRSAPVGHATRTIAVHPYG
jgi:hypothetical protein